MSANYLTGEQVEILLRPINPTRIYKDGKGYSHVKGWEIRAHLSRVFGFARWSEELLDLTLIYETQGANEKTSKPNWTVCYRATVRLTVCAPDGTVLATYAEAATGEGTNQPQRGEAHDLAIKEAETQALKRCAVNLGDSYGLGLYADGSTSALVKKVLVGMAPELLLPPAEAPGPLARRLAAAEAELPPVIPGGERAVEPPEGEW